MSDDPPTLDVGDHVSDQEDPDATMLVVGMPLERADEYVVDGGGPTAATVADYNEDYPADDAVVEVIFAGAADTDVDHAKRYAYPRSRLECVTPIHGDDDPRCAAKDCERPMDHVIHGVVIDGATFEVPTCGGHSNDDQEEDTITDDDGNEVPRHSEPADFGGGESTGVQDL